MCLTLVEPIRQHQAPISTNNYIMSKNEKSNKNEKKEKSTKPKTHSSYQQSKDTVSKDAVEHLINKKKK
ncbi:hypothetical protein [Sphingobacterium sp. JB170]|uniref:hypothetical protein n=1 Tax=Sphingobacterium sp. JB170 TaxID=1434842 RepID=UPI001C4E62C3|nr:hypothetical protein [Sphingobacterium sp. JB170]